MIRPAKFFNQLSQAMVLDLVITLLYISFFLYDYDFIYNYIVDIDVPLSPPFYADQHSTQPIASDHGFKNEAAKNFQFNIDARNKGMMRG